MHEYKRSTRIHIYTFVNVNVHTYTTLIKTFQNKNSRMLNLTRKRTNFVCLTYVKLIPETYATQQVYITAIYLLKQNSQQLISYYVQSTQQPRAIRDYYFRKKVRQQLSMLCRSFAESNRILLIHRKMYVKAMHVYVNYNACIYHEMLLNDNATIAKERGIKKRKKKREKERDLNETKCIEYELNRYTQAIQTILYDSCMKKIYDKRLSVCTEIIYAYAIIMCDIKLVRMNKNFVIKVHNEQV
eukprot:TRINITY_DN10261_c1_g2_i2.p2 TRINITY_DN10261_c1_g2~~TRINITY_DN10261_c1_g2_i2.p2  ORF type:complete len:243 (+),score=-9.93 TRINITY_DN10261_c1_g2_i2:510-1238(+)